MTKDEQVDWLCRLRADLNNGVIFSPWNKEYVEALTGILEQDPEDTISREDTMSVLRADQSFICTGDKLNAIQIVDSMPPANPQKMGHQMKMEE